MATAIQLVKKLRFSNESVETPRKVISQDSTCAASVVQSAREKRWIAVDILRFIAVLLMVQGHTFTAVMNDAVYPQHWYRLHNYIHGFTAPMFLFAAGIAFGLTTLRAWPQHLRLGQVFFKRIRRYVWIIMIGYPSDCNSATEPFS